MKGQLSTHCSNQKNLAFVAPPNQGTAVHHAFRPLPRDMASPLPSVTLQGSYFAPGTSTLSASVHAGNSYNAGGNVTINHVVNHGGTGGPESHRNLLTSWLSSVTPVNQYAIQKETREKLAPGTAKWIVDHPRFKDWLEAGSGTFWGVGIPGAGKTCLTSFVIQHLQEQYQELDQGNQTNLVIYTFCRFDDSLSVSQILCSLLQQLVEHSDPINEYVSTKLYGPNLAQKTTPTKSEVVTTFQGISNLLPRTFIVIDALDELHEDVQDEVLDILMALKQALFLTSREIDLLQIETPSLRIWASGPDLEAFVLHELHRRPKLRSLLANRKEVVEELVKHIQLASDGMFLLATLYLSSLVGVTSIAGVRKVIKDLPVSIGAMYELTLQRINSQSEEEKRLANMAIMWVTHARRQMSVMELLTALSIEPDSTCIDEDAVTDERTLVSVGCGLLELTSGFSIRVSAKTGSRGPKGVLGNVSWNTVRLIHYTAHDFFALRLTPNPHTYAATICAVYLDLSGIINHEYLESKLARMYPLASYAIQHLGGHAFQAAQEADGDIPPQVSHFLTHNTNLPLIHEPPKSAFTWFLERTLLKEDDRGSPIHFAALHGLLPILQDLPDASDAFGRQTTKGQTPLYYASLGGHPMVVKLILDHSDFSTPKESSSDQHPTQLVQALHVACRHGHTEIVQLLLSVPSIDVAASSFKGETALHIASSAGHQDIVQILLAKSSSGINSHVLPSAGSFTPLHYASIRGHVSIVEELLLSPTIDVNATGHGGMTALHYSVSYSHLSVVKLLGQAQSINLNAQDDQGSSALHIASMHGYTEILSYLLTLPSIDVNLKDKMGATPLDHARLNGRDEVGRCLIDSLAEVKLVGLYATMSGGPRGAWKWLLGGSLPAVETPAIADYDLDRE